MPRAVRERKSGSLLTRAKALVFNYVRSCCGNDPLFLKEVVAVCEKPAAPALKCSSEIEKHFIFGDDPSTNRHARKKSLRNELIDPLLKSGVCYIILQLELVH